MMCAAMAQQISEKAAADIRRQILDGTLAPGSQLPPERTFSEQLGISRTALRDALQALEGMGLVESHVGRGRFITRDVSSGQSAAAARNWLHLHGDDLASLNEVRTLLEPQAVASIPDGAVAQVAAQARALLERQQAAIRRDDLDDAARLDTAFHEALVAQAPNAPLRVLSEQLIAVAETAAQAVYATPGAAAHSLAQHEQIVVALEDGDPRAAARLLRRHTRTGFRHALSAAQRDR